MQRFRLDLPSGRTLHGLSTCHCRLVQRELNIARDARESWRKELYVEIVSRSDITTLRRGMHEETPSKYITACRPPGGKRKPIGSRLEADWPWKMGGRRHKDTLWGITHFQAHCRIQLSLLHRSFRKPTCRDHVYLVSKTARDSFFFDSAP